MTRKLSATLPADTLQVFGRVNGKETIWTNTEGQTWESMVGRAPDDTYKIELTIIKSNGVITETEITLYYGLHLITDRTLADVFSMNEKGTYNASDLNRVGQAINYVADLLCGIGYIVNVSPKTDWTIDDVPSTESMGRYIADLQEVRSKLTMADGIPVVPNSMSQLDYEKANDIEKMLLAVDDAVHRVKAGWYYSGEIYAGEVY